VVRHRIFTSSTPILHHQSSVSHRWNRVSYDLVCRENLRRWTDPASREYARIKSLTECLSCGDQKAFGTILWILTIGVLPVESTASLDTPICLVPVSGIVSPYYRVFADAEDASSYLSLTNGIMDLASLGCFNGVTQSLPVCRLIAKGLPPNFFQESLFIFGELHDYNTVRHQEANELAIVKVAEASHHLSGSYSIPI